MANARMQDLLQLLEIQDIKEGTPLWTFKMLEGRVEACKEHMGMSACDDCSRFDDCDLTKEYRIAFLYSNPTEPQQ